MKAGKFNGRSISIPHRQRGVVLLIALIILVAMTLAGIGMMRSIDTGSVVAGNRAFQQATMDMTDAGIAQAFNDLMAVSTSGSTPAIQAANRKILHFNHGDACSHAPGATAAGCPGSGNIYLPGYRSTPPDVCEVTQTCSPTSKYNWWTDSSNWSNPGTLTVPDPNNPATNMTVQYLIHRMCTGYGAAPPTPPAVSFIILTGANAGTKQLCQSNNASNLYCSAGGDCTGNGADLVATVFIYYRVTVRVIGPRNTFSYVQAVLQQQQ